MILGHIVPTSQGWGDKQVGYYLWEYFRHVVNSKQMLMINIISVILYHYLIFLRMMIDQLRWVWVRYTIDNYVFL